MVKYIGVGVSNRSFTQASALCSLAAKHDVFVDISSAPLGPCLVSADVDETSDSSVDSAALQQHVRAKGVVHLHCNGHKGEAPAAGLQCRRCSAAYVGYGQGRQVLRTVNARLLPKELSTCVCAGHGKE